MDRGAGPPGAPAVASTGPGMLPRTREHGGCMQPGDARRYVVEFIGPFALTFMGAGAIIATKGEDLVAIALAHGLAIGLMICAAGHISGGVYNPALTVALAATRQIPWPRAGGYIIVQCLGAIAAALLLKAMVPADAVAAVNLGDPGLG